MRTEKWKTPRAGVDRVVKIIAKKAGDDGLSLKQVSMGTGVSETAVRSWMVDGRDPTLTKVRAVAQNLGLDLALIDSAGNRVDIPATIWAGLMP